MFLRSAEGGVWPDLSEETLSQIAANGFSHCWTTEGRQAGTPLHA